MDQDISQLTDAERIEQIAAHYAEILHLVGEDTSREGLIKTPMRAAKALCDITSGYRTNAAAHIQSAIFAHEGSKVVTVSDIEFYSMCEHHILPFFGTISVAYIPDGKIVGLSKLARVVDACARKLQVQERLTAEVMQVIASALPTKGVLVTCCAQHLCMKMRGVEKQQSSTLTIEYCGQFETDAALRAETLAALNKEKNL